MPLYPIFFLLVVSSGTILSFFRGPIYGLITYLFIYFNIPSHQWWGGYLPDIRWSFIAAVLLTLASLLHFKKLGKIQFGCKSPATYLVLMLILMCMISPFSYSPELAWAKTYDFFRYIYILILIVLIVSDIKKYRNFLYSLIICYLYLAYQAHFYFKGGRLDGVGLPDANDANLLASLILLIIPFIVQFIIHGSKKEKIFSIIVFIPIVNVFMMCGSRGGFVGLLAGMLLLSVLEIRKNGILKIFFIICAVFVCFLGLMDQSYRGRIIGLGSSGIQGTVEENSSGRMAIWKEAIPILKDYPFGTGGDGFMELSPHYLSNVLIESNVGKRAIHNTYLLFLIEQGPLGLLLYLSLIISTFFIFFKTNNSSKITTNFFNLDYNFVQHQARSAICGLAGFWVAAFFIDRIYFEAFYIFLSIQIILYKFNCEIVENIQK